MRTHTSILFIAALVALPACTTSPVETDFGNSVQALHQAQVADPKTLTNPSAAPVEGVEQEYAKNVLDEWRKDVDKPAEVQPELVINVGGRN